MKKKASYLTALLAALACLLIAGISVSAAGLSLNRSSVTLYTTAKTSIHLKASGARKIKWSSTNKSVATVSQTGTVKAKGTGTATIKAKAGSKTVKCKVTVKKCSVKLNRKTKTLYTSDTKTTTLKATVTGPKSGVTWSSSNPKVASVSSGGKVTARKAGTATITARANGKTAKCKITVKRKLTLKQAEKALNKYLDSQNIRYYINVSETSGSKHIIWVTYTGPGMKAKYEIGVTSGKAYESAPYFGIDMPAVPSVSKVYQFRAWDYI